MSHKMLRPFIVKVSVLGYFPLYIYIYKCMLTTVTREHCTHLFGIPHSIIILNHAPLVHTRVVNKPIGYG